VSLFSISYRDQLVDGVRNNRVVSVIRISIPSQSVVIEQGVGAAMSQKDGVSVHDHAL
jgi:hypothetical protein